jgi:hypothetical protein
LIVPADLYLHQGDRLPWAQATLADGNGDPVDLTTATSVRFVMRAIGAESVAIDQAASVVGDPTDGVVRYEWATADTEAADVGAYFGEFTVIFPGGAQTFPNPDPLVIVIGPSVAEGPVIDADALSAIRGRIGSKTPPTDAQLAAAFERLGSADAVALEVLEGRYAEMLSGPAKWAVEGDFNLDNTENIKRLATMIDELKTSQGTGPGLAVAALTRSDPWR